jgi:hypothetical protein
MKNKINDEIETLVSDIIKNISIEELEEYTQSEVKITPRYMTVYTAKESIEIIEEYHKKYEDNVLTNH